MGTGRGRLAHAPHLEGQTARDGYTGLTPAPPGHPGRERSAFESARWRRRQEGLPFDFFFDASDPTLGPFGSPKDPRSQQRGEGPPPGREHGYERALGSRLALECEVNGFAGADRDEIRRTRLPRPTTADPPRQHARASLPCAPA